MNKTDIILILIILIFSILLIIFKDDKKGNIATVYYDGKIIQTINLENDSEYDVKGYNGNIHLKVENNTISVTDENSPYHLCQKNKIKNNGESLICLPNKVIIKIGESEYDAVIGGV